jgi:hypothetical protein
MAAGGLKIFSIKKTSGSDYDRNPLKSGFAAGEPFFTG